jgi:hypothetical protein
MRYLSCNCVILSTNKGVKNIKITICCGLFYIQWLEMKRWLLILLILLWWSTKISSLCGKIVTAFITTNIITCINWKCIWWLSTVWNGKPYQHSYWTINPGNQRFHEQLTLEIRGIIIVNHRCLSFFVMVVHVYKYFNTEFIYIY